MMIVQIEQWSRDWALVATLDGSPVIQVLTDKTQQLASNCERLELFGPRVPIAHANM